MIHAVSPTATWVFINPIKSIPACWSAGLPFYFMSMTMRDLTGVRSGRLTVIKFAGRRQKKNVPYWECMCDCGNTAIIQAGRLTTARTKSCGCINVEWGKKMLTKHGMSESPTWISWNSARTRCNNPNSPDYKSYGGRGIIMAPEWNDSFQQFFDDMGERPSMKHSLEREDVNGNYEKGNCIWATAWVQYRNMRSSRYLKYKEWNFIITDWAKMLVVSDAWIRYKVKEMPFQDLIQWLLDNKITSIENGKFLPIKRTSGKVTNNPRSRWDK